MFVCFFLFCFFVVACCAGTATSVCTFLSRLICSVCVCVFMFVLCVCVCVLQDLELEERAAHILDETLLDDL